MGTVIRPSMEASLPELPEVEITRRHLEKAMVGRRLQSVRVTHDRTARYNATTGEIESRLSGRRVDSVGRRGKFLVVGLDDGYTMVAHLGMSGRFSIAAGTDAGNTEEVPHTHFVAILDNGAEISFIDPRTFGFIAVFDEDELADFNLSRLGPDAWLDPPSVPTLMKTLKGRTAPIKALLLDQRPIAGLGNIYADEALHLARIHPLTPGGDLEATEVAGLLEAIRRVLSEAIDSGGTTLDDLAYLLPDGQAGDNLDRLGVYARTDEPCLRCGTPVQRIVVRARSTHFCPRCQKP
ncbi:MAG: bifunctional DNA-formamidopyrimidine glycosylase/DNA-(apurinic or apyrimidinic site) lyase [Acidimicrobiia bacterium]